MAKLFLEELKFIKGIDPVADAFSGTVATDVVNMENHGKALFIIHKGVGTTGTSTITVEACDDVTPSNTSAIPFRYRAITSGDTPGDITAATTAGFTTTAGSSQLYIIEADASDIAADGNDYSYLRLKATEVADAAVLGNVLIILGESKYGVETPPTGIV